MIIAGKVAVVTGAGSGIGEAVSLELVRRGIKAIALVDRADTVSHLADSIAQFTGKHVPVAAHVGDATDEAFRRKVFDDASSQWGVPTICVPAAGITRDTLAAKLDKATGKAALYPLDEFRQVVEINLLAPIYWALEMVGRIAEDRHARGLGPWQPEEHVQGTVVFIGSVSSRGNKGQIAYAATKAGLEGAAATLTIEAMYHGVRCAVIHPGYTDTPMVQALGEQFIAQRILPHTQLRRLIHPEEIADAICFMIANSAVSGELWADAGWHPGNSTPTVGTIGTAK
jgi:3-oxoacyl-[acyl-carrier protein] reductase